ncbi:MAG: hypothetical protein Q7T80_14330 [Methanoregula sp.]|nr:hypothetical protein [Methanoregula sp.]
MDKKDIMYMIGALCIILIIALVIKPIMTGQPVNTGIALPSPEPAVTPGSMVYTNSTPQVITLVTTIPTTIPTPVPTWDANVSSVGFVDPSTYGMSENKSIPNSSRFDEKTVYNNMTAYAKFSGQYSGTTQVLKIPFPYWELVYTVQPFSELQPSKTQVIPTKGEGLAYSGLQGSYSTAAPDFSIQVMDADDPNRIVRTISPPGGIDLDLWLGKKKTVTNPQEKLKSSQLATVSSDTIYVDPRPWTEKFYYGQANYFFIINAHNLESYSIVIQVPSKYIGTY